MKLISTTGVTEINDQQIEVRTHKLLFQLGFVANCTPAILNNILVTLEKKGSNGLTTIIPKVGLHDLLEVSAQNEGLFRRSDDAVLGTVDVGNIGAVVLNSDEYLVLNMEGILAGHQVDIFAMDSPMGSDQFVKFDSDNVAANTREKDFSLVGVESIALPQAIVDEIYLEFENGRSIKYTREEIEAIVQEFNEIVSIDTITGTANYNYINWITLDVSGAVRLVYRPLTASAAHTIYRIKHVKA